MIKIKTKVLRIFQNLYIIFVGVKVYLVVAFSGQYKNISELVPYGLRDKVIMKEVIYIQSGHLVPQSSHYFTTNREAFQNLATDIEHAYGLSVSYLPFTKLHYILSLVAVLGITIPLFSVSS